MLRVSYVFLFVCFLQETPCTVLSLTVELIKLFLQVTETPQSQEKVKLNDKPLSSSFSVINSVALQQCNTYSVHCMQETWITSSLLCWDGEQVSDFSSTDSNFFNKSYNILLLHFTLFHSVLCGYVQVRYEDISAWPTVFSSFQYQK